MAFNRKEHDRKYHLAHKEHIRTYQREYRQKHKEKRSENRRKSQLRRYRYWKDQAYAHYGGYTCARCGITDPRCLSLDHINGGGTKHRRTIGKGSGIYRWLRDHDYPPGFQVLCMNCQFIKEYTEDSQNQEAVDDSPVQPKLF